MSTFDLPEGVGFAHVTLHAATNRDYALLRATGPAGAVTETTQYDQRTGKPFSWSSWQEGDVRVSVHAPDGYTPPVEP